LFRRCLQEAKIEQKTAEETPKYKNVDERLNEFVTSYDKTNKDK